MLIGLSQITITIDGNTLLHDIIRRQLVIFGEICFNGCISLNKFLEYMIVFKVLVKFVQLTFIRYIRET
jgi:hypothetical protein